MCLYVETKVILPPPFSPPSLPHTFKLCLSLSNLFLTGKWRTLNCYALFPALCKGQDSYEISDKHHETVLTGGCLPGFKLFGRYPPT